MESLLVIETSQSVKLSDDIIENAQRLKLLIYGEDSVELREKFHQSNQSTEKATVWLHIGMTIGMAMQSGLKTVQAPKVLIFSDQPEKYQELRS